MLEFLFGYWLGSSGNRSEYETRYFRETLPRKRTKEEIRKSLNSNYYNCDIRGHYAARLSRLTLSNNINYEIFVIVTTTRKGTNMNGKIDKVFKTTVTKYTDEDFDVAICEQEIEIKFSKPMRQIDVFNGITSMFQDGNFKFDFETE